MSENQTPYRPLDWFIDGPDEAGKVWLQNTGEPVEVRYLGNRDQVAEVFAEWLAKIDFGE